MFSSQLSCIFSAFLSWDLSNNDTIYQFSAKCLQQLSHVLKQLWSDLKYDLFDLSFIIGEPSHYFDKFGFLSSVAQSVSVMSWWWTSCSSSYPWLR